MLKRQYVSFYSSEKFTLNNAKNIASLFGLMLLFTFINGCSDVNHIFVDIEQQAIISCDGTGLKRLTIENESENIILEGTESVIHFDQVNNVARTTVNGNVVHDFKLTLKKNCNYTIRKDNGYDRGPITVTFETDNLGKMR